MTIIESRTPGESWLKAARAVIKSGHPIKDGDVRLKEILNVHLTVDRPLSYDSILRLHADGKMISWMQDNFLKLDPVPGWGYSYGQRFFSYDGIDQISRAIEKLKKNQDSKSATVSLMDPPGDASHMPCIVALDFKVRDGRLMTTAFFRSQDAGKKMYADIICLGEIARRVADGVGVEAGPLHILIVSLHVYETEWNKINALIAGAAAI